VLSVTSWYIDQLADRSSIPVRQFLLGTSDYSDRVIRWPTLKRTANNLQTTKVAVQLDNADGALNDFYSATYKIVQTGYLKLGFTHATSGTEYLTLFTGEAKEVKYQDEKCEIRLRDLLHNLGDRKVGESSAPVTFSEQIPSDIGWTLCTCYGYLDTTQSSANPNINWQAFQEWAQQFSEDSVVLEGYFDGQKVIEALSTLCEQTDSAVWINGDGKLTFRKFIEPDSNDMTITRDHFTDLEIDVETLRLVNKAFVEWDYAVESDYWLSVVYSVDSLSVSSFGVHDKLYRNENIWYTGSLHAINYAQRKTTLFSQPPRRFNVETDLYAIRPELGETIRLVDSFFSITSGGGFRLVEQSFNLDTGKVDLELDEATTMNAFYLDVSCLDGNEVLL